MISRLSKSIIQKNGILPLMVKDVKFMNLKLTHLFSDKGKNPFDKFKRNNKNVKSNSGNK